MDNTSVKPDSTETDLTRRRGGAEKAKCQGRVKRFGLGSLRASASPRELRCRLRHAALYLVLLPIGASCSRSSEAPAIAQSPGAITTRELIELRGRPVRIESAGLRQREPGLPVVVFENGGGTPLETWDLILTAVARDAPVLAYDRPGIGSSDWDKVVPSPTYSAALLRDLLDTMDIEPPYVLVGHSWGGLLVRYFAQQYPNDVAGLVYIDPTDVLESEADFVAMLRSVGAPQPFIDAFSAAEADEEALARATPAQRAEWEALVTLRETDTAARGVQPPLSVPTALLQSGRTLDGPPEAELREGIGEERARAYVSAFREHRLERMRRWLPEGESGSLHVVEEAGHFVHRNAPDLVIEVIRSILSDGSRR